MEGDKINETRRPLGWCGSNNMVAYVSKPKFMPFHASSLGNQNTNNDSQTAKHSHSLSLPSPPQLQECKGEKCSYPIPVPGCPFQIEFVLKNKLLKFLICLCLPLNKREQNMPPQNTHFSISITLSWLFSETAGTRESEKEEVTLSKRKFTFLRRSSFIRARPSLHQEDKGDLNHNTIWPREKNPTWICNTIWPLFTVLFLQTFQNHRPPPTTAQVFGGLGHLGSYSLALAQIYMTYY